MGAPGWSAFLEAYHAAHPAVTEDLLLPMRGPRGLQPYAWLAEGLPATGPVLDVCCGSAPVADVVGHDRYTGVDLSRAELAQAALRRPGARVVRGDAMTSALTARPPADSGAGTLDRGAGRPAAVTVAMALMLLPLEAFLRRAAALLPDGGRLHAMVPTREDAAGTGYGTLLRLLGEDGHGYRQPLPPAVVAQELDRAGFTLEDDEVAVFDRHVPPEDVDLVVGSFYVRDGGPGPEPARGWLTDRSREPDFLLRYPLRRLRAVRTGTGR